MVKKIPSPKAWRIKNGFSLAELTFVTAIVGVLGSVAYPNYINHNNKANLFNAKSTVSAIPPIISAFVDETGETPTSWDDLASIAVVMTNNGPATGNLDTPITLPNSIYDLSITGPVNSVYTLIAKRMDDRGKGSPCAENANECNEYGFSIKSCFNIRNGASDIKTGHLSKIANTLNCG